NPYRDMVMDARGFEYDWDADSDDEGFQLSNANAYKFFDLLKNADETVWSSRKMTKLSMMTRLRHIKSKHDFGVESRNVRIGLATDGFSP
ncbi:hypothetical protein CFOL_v3_11488, partial [Cephalotus follicularis]